MSDEYVPSEHAQMLIDVVTDLDKHLAHIDDRFSNIEERLDALEALVEQVHGVMSSAAAARVNRGK